MKTTLKEYSDIPFEKDKTYKTKFQTGENFIIKEIITVKDRVIFVKGIYEKSPKLGLCLLNPDRLISDKKFEKEIDVCSCCNEKL